MCAYVQLGMKALLQPSSFYFPLPARFVMALDVKIEMDFSCATSNYNEKMKKEKMAIEQSRCRIRFAKVVLFALS